jgi:uracil-DNA glycosylase
MSSGDDGGLPAALAPDLLRRFLRQRADLAGGEFFLETLSRPDALATLRGRPASAAPPASRTAAVAAPAPGAATVAPPAPHTAAAPGASVTAGAAALPLLAAEAAACTRCRLHGTRSSVVFGEGNPEAEVVVVGEAPGGEEDRTGRPFVGPAGKLLDLLLASAGFPRDRVYICNVLKCRPPENRNPMADEVACCATFLHRQLDAIRPRVILAVGTFAAQTLLGSGDGIRRLRGRVHAYRGVPLVATYHPAYLLRSPEGVPAVWEDLQLLLTVVDAGA